MATLVSVEPKVGMWLRSRNFDLVFILGIAFLALCVGAAATQMPDIFRLLLLVDLWLLSFHHVVAAYSRLCFDARSFRAHQFLVMGVPVIVLAGTCTLAFGVGLWSLMTIYLYWQWFHYTRQSWGIARAYQRRTGELSSLEIQIGDLAMYLVPIWGILNRTAEQPARFLGLELRVPPLPLEAAELAGIAAIVAVTGWSILRVWATFRGRPASAYTLYVASHFVMFYVGYVLIDDLTTGWLAVNVWHNGQYLLFVWLHNNRQYGGGQRVSAKLMSHICQERNAWLYVLVCLAISTILYLGIRNFATTLAVGLIVTQTINYHHYIVDAIIWRRSRTRSRFPLHYLALRPRSVTKSEVPPVQ